MLFTWIVRKKRGCAAFQMIKRDNELLYTIPRVVQFLYGGNHVYTTDLKGIVISQLKIKRTGNEGSKETSISRRYMRTMRCSLYVCRYYRDTT